MTARTIRTIRGMCTSEIATVATSTPEPAPATIMSTRITGGNASATSMSATVVRSIALPRSPASMPSAIPTRYASAVARKATMITVAPPWRNRLSASRPRLSVPSGASALGPVNGTPTISLALCGLTSGPSTATATMTSTSTRPTRADQLPVAPRTIRLPRNASTLPWRRASAGRSAVIAPAPAAG